MQTGMVTSLSHVVTKGSVRRMVFKILLLKTNAGKITLTKELSEKVDMAKNNNKERKSAALNKRLDSDRPLSQTMLQRGLF